MPWMIPSAILGGSVIGSLGAGSAAKTQANATTQGIGEQRREFDITRADTAPYRDAGTGALAQLQAALGMKGPDTVYPESRGRSFPTSSRASSSRGRRPRTRCSTAKSQTRRRRSIAARTQGPGRRTRAT
jgi:hypothetical protein